MNNDYKIKYSSASWKWHLYKLRTIEVGLVTLNGDKMPQIRLCAFATIIELSNEVLCILVFQGAAKLPEGKI